MAKIVSKTTYERTVSEGINFSDLDSKELITKEVLQQVLGIRDPGDLFVPKNYTFTLSGTATAAGSVDATDGATPGNAITFAFADADTTDIIINKIIGALATTKPGIYNYNIVSTTVLTISHIFSSPNLIDQFIASTDTDSGITLEVTVTDGVALQTAYYTNPDDRKDIV